MSKSRDIADSAATINYIDNVTSDVQSQLNTLDTALDNISVTSGTLTKTFTSGESASISLTSSVLAPVVSVTKEVPQSGVTNNNWDVNSTTENYTRLNSAPATTLDFVGFDVSTVSFVDSFSVAAQDAAPTGVTFNTDGTKMFIVGAIGGSINEYTLSTGFDVSTASFVDSFSVSAQDATPRGIAFNTDGTKMFVLGDVGADVNEYTLSTGFDVSTASFSQNFSVSAQETFPSGIAFNTDGTKMFVSGVSSDYVNEYDLSTGFDVSTASFSQFFSIGLQDGQSHGLAFNTDGTKMFIVGYNTDAVYQYTLSTGFDVSTASYSNVSFSIASQETEPRGIAFSADGTKMFIVGNAGDDVNEYDITSVSVTLGTGSFASADVGKTIEANSGEFILTATDGSYVETTAPTSYAQVASGSWSMYGVVYNAADGDLELSSYIGAGFDISGSAYTGVSVQTAQDNGSQGVAFSADGSKLYFIGINTDKIYQYSLPTAFSLSGATYDSVSFSVASQDGVPYDFAFNPAGTKLFVLGEQTGYVYQYSLSAAFNIGTASYDSVAFNIGPQESAPQGLTFNPTGTKMFICGASGQDVNEYTLSSAFNLATASFVDSFSVSAQDTFPSALAFNTDGTVMLVLGQTGDAVYSYSLTSGFDVSTASFSNSFSVSSQASAPTGIAFSATGSSFIICCSSTDYIYEYTSQSVNFVTGYQPVHTTASTDTTYWTDINSMTADQNAGDGEVYYAISTDDRTTWTVIDNTDGERDIVRSNSGTWQYNSNGTYASETWVNGATNTELATLAEAMEGATTPYSMQGAAYDSVSLDISAQITQVKGMTFNNDGSKMYIVDNSGDGVREYEMSSAYSLSTASYARFFSTSAQETTPNSIAFNSDGSKMFIVGTTGDDVGEYALSTAFNVATASFTQNFSVATQDTSPFGIAFNTDGTKMFISADGSNSILEYGLSTGFDISTASYSQNFSVTDTNPRDIQFASSGTVMFLLGAGSDKVYKYSLSTAFDISTASLGESFSVNSQAANPQGMAISADGETMFISDDSSDSVYQYSTVLYTNQMDKTQLDAVTDPNHIALGDDLDLAIVFNMTSGSTVPSSDGVAINYDANVLNKGAVLGTDYDFDAPAQNSVRITALAGNNLKVRVV